MGALSDSGLTSNDEILLGIKPGAIIKYHLLSSDIPTNPDKLWRGKVKHCTANSMQVELLEPDYSGMIEVVYYEQVVSVE